MSWWHILIALYVISCATLIVYYIRSIHRQYQIDRTFFEIVRSEDWEV